MITQRDWELIQNGDMDARNRVWVEYQNSVNFVAQKISASLPRHVDLEDLKSAGQFGLLDAIEKYEPERGYRFETYAVNRIRGAILDDLRSLDWVPRSIRSRERQIETAISDLTHELGRQPTIEEVCDLLDTDPEEISKVINASASGTIYNIDMPVDYESDLTIADSLSQDIGDLSDVMAVFDAERMVSAIDNLPEREKMTVTLHYYLGYTLADIGKQFGVTESRVCQIHTRALKIIRKDLIE